MRPLGDQRPLDLGLGGDPGVVGAQDPFRAPAAHAVIASQAVLDRVVQRMAHVQHAGDVGRRDGDRVVLVRRALRGGMEQPGLQPFLHDPRLHLGGVVAGRGSEVGHGVASVDPTRRYRLFPLVRLISSFHDDTGTAHTRGPPLGRPQPAGPGIAPGHHTVGDRGSGVRPLEPARGDGRAGAAGVWTGADAGRAGAEVPTSTRRWSSRTCAYAGQRLAGLPVQLCERARFRAGGTSVPLAQWPELRLQSLLQSADGRTASTSSSSAGSR